MPEIMTVRGPIKSEDLGFTSMHEHILYDGSIYRQRYVDILDIDPSEEPNSTDTTNAFGSVSSGKLPKDFPVHADDLLSLENIGFHRRNFFLTWDAVSMHDEEVMEDEMADFKSTGGGAIVDMSAPGLRSNLPAIKRLSEKTDLHVITTTGLYTEDSWPDEFCDMSVEQYMSYMLREVEEGIDGTGIKAGHLKAAITDLSKQQEKLLRAVARVSNETGLAVTIHPGFIIGSDGRRIVKILQEEGVDLQRVTIAHLQQFIVECDLKKLVEDPNTWGLKLDYAKELLDQGVNLSIDTFGHYWDVDLLGFIRPTEWQKLAALLALLKEGYSPQIVLGTDTFLKIQTRRFGGEGFSRLTRSVIPFLKGQLSAFNCVSDFDIRMMTVDNPARLLSY
jgi:phosphotriesterase-related protein